jgi:hypothetical protein
LSITVTEAVNDGLDPPVKSCVGNLGTDATIAGPEDPAIVAVLSVVGTGGAVPNPADHA